MSKLLVYLLLVLFFVEYAHSVFVFRFVTLPSPYAFKPRSAKPKNTDLEQFCRQAIQSADLEDDGITTAFKESNDVPKGRKYTAAGVYYHCQEAFGNGNANSPFISLTYDPNLAAHSGSLNQIVTTATHIAVFDIPQEHLFTGIGGVSLREGEILTDLPDIEEYLITTTENRWRGLRADQLKGLKLRVSVENVFIQLKIRQKVRAKTQTKQKKLEDFLPTQSFEKFMHLLKLADTMKKAEDVIKGCSKCQSKALKGEHALSYYGISK